MKSSRLPCCPSRFHRNLALVEGRCNVSSARVPRFEAKGDPPSQKQFGLLRFLIRWRFFPDSCLRSKPPPHHVTLSSRPPGPLHSRWPDVETRFTKRAQPAKGVANVPYSDDGLETVPRCFFYGSASLSYHTEAESGPVPEEV